MSNWLSTLQSHELIFEPIPPKRFADYFSATARFSSLEIFTYGAIYLQEEKVQQIAAKETLFPLNRSTWRVMWNAKKKVWQGQIWQSIPLPDSDDTLFSEEDFGDVIRKIIQYFYGKPEIIGDWIIPFYRNPELRMEDVLSLLPEAKSMSIQEFHNIAQSYLDHLLANVNQLAPVGNLWDDVFATLFIRAPHKDPGNKEALYIRRDGQEAFIVSE
jgi:hypothetical protein